MSQTTSTSGVTTWQHIPDDLAESMSRPAAPAGVSNRVIGGVLTNVSGKVTEMSPPLRASETEIAPKGGSILSTAKNNGGFHTANITPDSTVEIPGFGRTTAKVAAHLGYLTQGADGRYVEVSPSGKSEGSSTGGNLEGSKESSQQLTTSDGQELFDPDIESAYGEMVGKMAPGTHDSLLAYGNALLAQGMDADAITQRLGQRMASVPGIEPSEAAVYADVAILAWQDQADDAIRASGADPSDFYQWAKENRRNELQNAVNGHLFGRSTKAYRELVNDYFDNTMPSEKALKAAGIPTKIDGKETMVKLKGHWMFLGSAVKARLI